MLESVITRSNPAFSIGFSFSWTFDFGEVFWRGLGLDLCLRAIEFTPFEIHVQNYLREENYGQLKLKRVDMLENEFAWIFWKKFFPKLMFLNSLKSASFFDEVLILEMPNNITALKVPT